MWQAVIFAAGLLPVLFAVTGTMMWLRRRRNRRALERRRAAAMGAAAVP